MGGLGWGIILLYNPHAFLGQLARLCYPSQLKIASSPPTDRLRMIQPPTTYREQVRLLIYPKAWLRLVGYFAIVDVLTLIILGVIFMMILLPLTLALLRLSFVWTPLYHLAGRVMGLKGLPEHLAKPPTWFMIYSLAWALGMPATVAVCIRILFFSGFCNQNLICMLGRLALK